MRASSSSCQTKTAGLAPCVCYLLLHAAGAPLLRAAAAADRRSAERRHCASASARSCASCADACASLATSSATGKCCFLLLPQLGNVQFGGGSAPLCFMYHCLRFVCDIKCGAKCDIKCDALLLGSGSTEVGMPPHLDRTPVVRARGIGLIIERTQVLRQATGRNPTYPPSPVGRPHTAVLGPHFAFTRSRHGGLLCDRLPTTSAKTKLQKPKSLGLGLDVDRADRLTDIGFRFKSW